MNGSGTLLLGGSNPSFSGTTTVNNGFVWVCNSEALQSSTVNIGPSGFVAFDSSDTSFTFGNVSGSGTLNMYSGLPMTLTVGGNNASTIFSGSVLTD